MTAATAIVLSANPVTLVVPGVTVLGSVQRIGKPGQLHDARLNAVLQVDTPYCFFLDDDDELPADYLSVLGECIARDAALAYTHELVRQAGKPDRISKSGTYTREKHLACPMLVHHLAVMRTVDAQAAVHRVPRGEFWTEMLLYAELAKTSAAYVDRIGYIWNRGNGVNSQPKFIIAQMASATYCNQEAVCH